MKWVINKLKGRIKCALILLPWPKWMWAIRFRGHPKVTLGKWKEGKRGKDSFILHVHLERVRGGGITEEGGTIEPKKGHTFLCEGHNFLCNEGHKFRGVNSSIGQTIQYVFRIVTYNWYLAHKSRRISADKESLLNFWTVAWLPRQI